MEGNDWSEERENECPWKCGCAKPAWSRGSSGLQAGQKHQQLSPCPGGSTKTWYETPADPSGDGRHWCQALSPTLDLAERFLPGRAVLPGLHNPNFNCHTCCRCDSCLQTRGGCIAKVQWIMPGFFQWLQLRQRHCSHSKCPLFPFFRLCLDTSQDLKEDGSSSSNHSAGQGFTVCFCIKKNK